jgi:zinc protease
MTTRHGRLWLAVLALWVFCVPALAATPVPIHEFTLKNGLRVVVVSLHRSPVVSHNLMIAAGAADDPLGASGVAHFLEHMMFKGTPTVPEGDYTARIERLGGQFNAFTSADMTGYYVTIAKEHLPEIMTLEADRMMHLAPKPETYLTERDVIVEERRMRTDNVPVALLGEAMNAVLFPHHPYGTPIIGWAHEMKTLNQAQVEAYKETHYIPANAVLVLVGDMTETEARQLAETHYGAWQGGAKPSRTWVSDPPRITSSTVTLRDANVHVPQWTRSYIAPSFGTNRDQTESRIMPLILAEEILGNARTGVLYTELVEKRKVATDVSISYNPYVLGEGTFDVTITPAAGVSMRAFARAYQEAMHTFTQSTIDATALKRARNQLKAATILARDSIQGMGFIFSQLVMIGVPPEWFNTWEAKVDAVTPAHITDAVAKTLQDETAVTGFLLPAKKPEATKGAPR